MEEKSPSTTFLFDQSLSVKKTEDLASEELWSQGLVLRDEWANTLTHGLGFILSLIGLMVLLVIPLQEEDYWKLTIFTIYGGSLVLLYMASTLYHAVRSPKWKKILRTVDHCAIYVLIAGSYTPFTMILLKGVWGWTLFSIIWVLACFGITFKIFFKHRFEILSTCIYLFMGWLVIVATEPLINRFHYAGLCWLVAGGLFYTGGVVFYALDKRRFYHAIWHLCVLGGSVCHYFAVFLYL